MSMKIGADGIPYDPAVRAREALQCLRDFASEILDVNVPGADPQDVRMLFHGCLNAIADRLQTCDALEHKLERLKVAHGGLDAEDAAAHQPAKTDRPADGLRPRSQSVDESRAPATESTQDGSGDDGVPPHPTSEEKAP